MLRTQRDSGTIETQKYSTLYISPFEDTLFLSDVIIGPNDGDPPVNTEKLLLKYNFEYILQKAKSMLWSLIKPEERELFDIEDIADQIFIHFWEVLQDKEREPIRYPTTYIASMIHNKVYDEIRKHFRHSSSQPFSMLPDSAFQEVNAMLSSNSGMSDPSVEYERRYRDAQSIHRYAYAISKLPARQKLAMTCEILEEADNLAWMTDALIIYGVDTQVQWPTDKKAKQRLQANLPAARLAVAKCLHIDISTFPKRRRAVN